MKVFIACRKAVSNSFFTTLVDLSNVAVSKKSDSICFVTVFYASPYFDPYYEGYLPLTVHIAYKKIGFGL